MRIEWAVIPAKAGIQCLVSEWHGVSACAGTTQLP